MKIAASTPLADVYTHCPQYQGTLVCLRQTQLADAPALLACYADEAAVPLFNTDNCHGDTFFYQTQDRMEQAILFWQESYARREFVRWTVRWRATGAVLGTVEMFHRKADDLFDGYGILRIDLASAWETVDVVSDLLHIAQSNFPHVFGVQRLLTKAVEAAQSRRAALLQNGWRPLGQKFMAFDDYYLKEAASDA